MATVKTTLNVVEENTNRLAVLIDDDNVAAKDIKAILEEAGSNMDKIVKTTVFLSDMGNFVKMNEVYKEFFSGDYPARSASARCGYPTRR